MHKFVCTTENEHKPYTAVENIEFVVHQDATLDDMCDAFTSYLKAVGYPIKEGFVLDIVPEDGYSDKGWDEFFEEKNTVTEDFIPRKKLWDATPEEWDNAARKTKMS